MIISKTKLTGVLKIKLDPFKDFRGEYIEIFNKNIFNKIQKKIEFIQDDVSISKKNVIRGIHGDFKTWKLVTCLHGKFMLVVVNNLKSHKQYKKYEIFNLSEFNNIQILIPPGFGNGHLVKSNKTIFHYKQSTLYNRNSQFTIKWNDPTLKIRWGIKNPVLSKRDK